MLTTKPTKKQINEWKSIYSEYHNKIKPNRRNGKEVDDYFRANYSHQMLNSSKFEKVVKDNIFENEYSFKKLKGNEPIVHTYCVDNVYVGIDLTSGEFHVESKEIDKMIQIYDDLFVFRGLDEDDLHNFFLVAQYVQLSKR